ncbi:MAG: hypothetical protein KGH65_05080 [Candidatus Micrarchaeota archaeon]|nr:hypothetical protein [Candidatus Micrarchaeota archaeon]
MSSMVKNEEMVRIGFERPREQGPMAYALMLREGYTVGQEMNYVLTVPKSALEILRNNGLSYKELKQAKR